MIHNFLRVTHGIQTEVNLHRRIYCERYLEPFELFAIFQFFSFGSILLKELRVMAHDSWLIRQAKK